MENIFLFKESFWIFLKDSPHHQRNLFFYFYFFLKILFIYLWETHREAETQAEGGETGSMQGSRCGTRSQDPGIMPWAKGKYSTTESPRGPYSILIFIFWESKCTHTSRRRGDRGRENPKQVPSPVQSLMWGSVSGPWDHDLSWNQESDT